jgi:predicted dehydrogenase
LGGGPVVSLGSHQIDVINWFIGANPSSVMASGRTSYYDKKSHQWYDTVMAVYEYETDQGAIYVCYQMLSHNRSDGCFERFFGEQGTLELSEASNRAIVFPELMNSDNKVWARCVKEGRLVGHGEMMKVIDKLTVEQVASKFFVMESLPLTRFGNVHDIAKGIPWHVNRRVLNVPVGMYKPFHQPHLENFFDAIRGKAKLNCPAEIGYEAAVAVLKINAAVEAERKLEFEPAEFKAWQSPA